MCHHLQCTCPPMIFFADDSLLPNAEDTFQYAMSSNGAWAGYKAYQNPQFFPKLASGQAPQIRESSSRFPPPPFLQGG